MVIYVAATLLAWCRDRLAEGGAAASLVWLLDVGAGLERKRYYSLALHPQATIELSRDLDELTRLWHRHLNHAPLQYLLGRCPWRDFMLTVAPGVLIPRPETELLADVAISLTDDAPAGTGLWADLGTGSGCLALALATAFPDCHGVAVDQDPTALAVAARNLESVAGRVRLLAGNWWQPLQPWWGRLTMVVSNPPYIPTSTLARLEPVVRCHEPHPALDGGPDGLACFRTLLAGVSALAPGGWLVVEHGQGQAPDLEPLFATAGLTAVRRHQDLEGNDRFLAACAPHHWP
ncbi:MAG: peptide chain release factor N(5)-glutamine methyltransferase [Synechococcus sp. SB0668_bin_13]|nr:peptide chain release factor N(5)-glutamine methyltransferase [Synechococcus sp. SB0668_bin_13]